VQKRRSRTPWYRRASRPIDRSRVITPAATELNKKKRGEKGEKKEVRRKKLGGKPMVLGCFRAFAKKKKKKKMKKKKIF
jgi:hypothetical protein